jgi:hypothetical protein
MRRYLLLIILFVLMQGVFAQKFIPDTLRSCSADSVLLELMNESITILKWAQGDINTIIAGDTSQIWVTSPGWYYAYGESSLITPYWDSTYVIILDVQIATPDTSMVCGDTIRIGGSSDQYEYLWQPLGLTGQEIDVFPRDTSIYTAYISNPAAPAEYCIDSISIVVEPVIMVDTLIQTEMACPDEPEAVMDIDLSSGFPPYHYEWEEGYPYMLDSSIVMGIAGGNYAVEITDSLGCRLHYSFEVKDYQLPGIEIETTPGDTIYFTKPFIDITYFNLSQDTSSNLQYKIDNFVWDLGDGTTKSEAAFSYEYKVADPLAEEPETFNLKFSYHTYYGCPGKDSVEIVLKPVKMIVTNVLTPNGDEYNSFFKAELDAASQQEKEMFVNDFYLHSELYVINRWGVTVYSDKDYKNDWDGSNLSDGTYYYVLKCWGKNTEKGRPHIYKGALQILR